MSQIYYISKTDILDKNILINHIYSNHELNYYYSDDFSLEFYILLARAGFISVSLTENNQEYILPNIQVDYAVLQFDNLHISKKVKKLLNKPELYSFSINNSLKEVLDGIDNYHNDNWIVGKYRELIENLYNQDFGDEFKIMCFELRCNSTGKLIAGEVGYKIGSTYTSLSGFSTKAKEYNNWGKLQMILLSNYLENNSYSFWNLGQSFMQYKLDLGAKVLPRLEFLSLFLKNI